MNLIQEFCLFQTLTDATLDELKSCFMEAYDDNQDGKIDIREVSTLHLVEIIICVIKVLSVKLQIISKLYI